MILSMLITSPPDGVPRYCFHPVCLSVCLSLSLCVFFWEGRGGGTPYARAQWELYRFKFEKFDLRVGLEPMTSWILVWRSTNWAIRRSDESSLGILRCTICLTKFNHLYLGTGCACFFWEARGGTPLRHGHKESYTDLNLKNSTSSQYFGILFLGY